jgi:hypothetical protein
MLTLRQSYRRPMSAFRPALVSLCLVLSLFLFLVLPLLALFLFLFLFLIDRQRAPKPDAQTLSGPPCRLRRARPSSINHHEGRRLRVSLNRRGPVRQSTRYWQATEKRCPRRARRRRLSPLE